MKKPIATIAMVSLAILTATSQAAVLVNYAFPSASASQTSGDLSGTNVTFGSFTDQVSSPTPFGFSSTSNSIYVRFGATDDSGTLAEAILDNAYVTFTLTNNTASTYDLSQLSFDLWYDPVGNSSETGSMYVMSNLSGFTDGDELGSITKITTDATTSNVVAGLSSLGNLGASESIVFRLYFADNANNTSPIYRVDNVTVTGDLIPEPSAALLGGLGLLALLRRRR